MKNRKIEEILADYQAAKEMSSRDTSNIPYNTRAAIQNAMRAAKDQVVELRREYDDKLFSNAYAVVVEGDPGKVEEFKVATTSIGGFVFNFDDLYENIASVVEPSIGFTRVFGINQGFMMMQALRQILESNGVEFEVKDPGVGVGVVVRTHQDVVDYIRNTLLHTFGNAIMYLYARANLLRRALTLGHAKKALAVAFVGGGVDETHSVAPLFKNIALVDVTDAVIDQNYAISTYNKLNKKPKKADSHNDQKENENE
jgi:hypothetical protein